MNWRGAALVSVALASCANEPREATGGPASPDPALPILGGSARIEVVEAEAVIIPVGYRARRYAFVGMELTSRLGTASDEDFLVRGWGNEVAVASGTTGTVEMGFFARSDGVVEGAETLWLRPRVRDGMEEAVDVGDAEIGIVITDGRTPGRQTIEVVEGQSVAVQIHYEAVWPLEDLVSVEIGLAASYGTASARDILLMERDRINVAAGRGKGVVDFGFMAVRDGVREGEETLILRPVTFDDDTGVRVRLGEAGEIAVVVRDGTAPCSGVDIRVRDPVVVGGQRHSGRASSGGPIYAV